MAEHIELLLWYPAVGVIFLGVAIKRGLWTAIQRHKESNRGDIPDWLFPAVVALNFAFFIVGWPLTFILAARSKP